jgi:MFS family permease
MATDGDSALEGNPRWRTSVGLLAVYCGYAGTAMIYDALPPIIVQIAQHYGGGDRGLLVAQFASSLPFFGLILSGLLTDLMARRWGLRNVLLASLLIYGFTGSAGAFIDQAWLLLGSRFALGVAAGAMLTCCMSYIAVNFDDEQKARMPAMLLTFGGACAFSFILISGYVATTFNWRAPFLLHAAVSIAFLVPVLLMPPGSVVARESRGWWNLSELKPAFPAAITALVLQALVATFMIQLALMLGGLPIGTPTAIARVFALMAVSSTIVSYIFGRWFSSAWPPGIAAVAVGSIAAAMFCAWAGWSIPVFAASTMAMAVGASIGQAAVFTWAMRVTKPAAAASAMGLMYSSLYLGAAVGPALAAPVSLHTGSRLLIGSMGILTVAAAVITTTMVSFRKARTLR